MKVTLDSTESLQDALRVVGALYGVRLVVADDDSDQPVARESAQRPTRRSRRSSAAATTAELRAWARANNVDVNERGPVPASVRDAYAAAT